MEYSHVSHLLQFKPCLSYALFCLSFVYYRLRWWSTWRSIRRKPLFLVMLLLMNCFNMIFSVIRYSECSQTMSQHCEGHRWLCPCYRLQILYSRMSSLEDPNSKCCGGVGGNELHLQITAPCCAEHLTTSQFICRLFIPWVSQWP